MEKNFRKFALLINIAALFVVLYEILCFCTPTLLYFLKAIFRAGWDQISPSVGSCE